MLAIDRMPNSFSNEGFEGNDQKKGWEVLKFGLFQ